MTAPVVRARVVEYLAAHVVPGIRRYGGQVPVDADVLAMSHDLGISPHDAVETLWHLQKRQIVTFRERKGPSGSHISKIRLAESAINGVPVERLTTKGEAIDQAIDILEVTADLTAKAEAAIVTFPNTSCRYKRVAPEWCIEHDSIWTRGDLNCAAEWERILDEQAAKSGALGPRDEDEVGAGVAQYDGPAATTATPEASDDLPAILVPPLKDDYPNIRALLAERGSLNAARTASDILAEAGLEDLALTVIDAVRTFSPLEEEVLALADRLGWDA
jgi:hypothetical protein